MDPKNPAERTGDEQPFYYKNGESEVERLMREHLNTPGHTISDEDLRRVKLGVDPQSPSGEPVDEKDAEAPGEAEGGIPPESTWDVLDA